MKRKTIIKGVMHLQKAESSAWCPYCKKDVELGKWAVKGRRYVHIHCLLEKLPELKPRFDKIMPMIVAEEV